MPFRADLRVQARRVRKVLRLVPGHQQAGRCRRDRSVSSPPSPSGEPGTQLTLRSFHSGGVAAASDITQGLPRVTELFGARTPKGEAPITEFAGSIKIVENDRGRQIILTPDADSGAPKEDGVIKPITYQVSSACRSRLPTATTSKVGTQLVEGSVDPKKILTIPRQARRPGQHRGGSAHRVPLPRVWISTTNNIEVIVHQMTRRVTIIDSATPTCCRVSWWTTPASREINRNIVKNGGRPAVGRPALMGITKASLATDSGCPPHPSGRPPACSPKRPLREGRRPQGPQGERHHR